MMNHGRFRRSLLIGALFFQMSSLHVRAQVVEFDPQEGWTTTNAGIDLIRYFVAEKFPCYESNRNLLGCFELINELGRQVSPAQGLVGEANKVELTSVKVQLPSVTSDTVEKSEIDTLTSTAAYIIEHQTQPLDFVATARQLIERLPPGVSVQKATGGAINAMLRLHDWHSHIDAIEGVLDRMTGDHNSVESRVVADVKTPILVLHIADFESAKACNQVRAAVLGTKAKGIVIDVRGNPGGLVEQAKCIFGLFAGPNVLLREQKVVDGIATDQIQTEFSPVQQITKLPLVILIDNLTASAAEILAGALQDYHRAWIVGVRSWGKGSMQDPQELPQDPSIWYYQTSALYELPGGRAIQARGIEPDFEVASDPASIADNIHLDREEDYLPYVLAPGTAQRTLPRTSEIQKIKSCLTTPRATHATDRQLLAAQQILNCARKPKKA